MKSSDYKDNQQKSQRKVPSGEEVCLTLAYTRGPRCHASDGRIHKRPLLLLAIVRVQVAGAGVVGAGAGALCVRAVFTRLGGSSPLNM